VVDVWQRLAGFLAANQALPKIVELSQTAGHPLNFHGRNLSIQLPVEEVEKAVLSRRLEGFKVYAGSGSKSVDYSPSDYASARRDTIMACEFDDDARIPTCWHALIEDIMSHHACVGIGNTSASTMRGNGGIPLIAFTSGVWGNWRQGSGHGLS